MLVSVSVVCLVCRWLEPLLLSGSVVKRFCPLQSSCGHCPHLLHHFLRSHCLSLFFFGLFLELAKAWVSFCCNGYITVSVSESPSSWLWSPSSAFMVWRRLTWLTCVSPFRRSSAGGSCGRLTAGHSLCHAPGLRSVGETCCVGPGHMEQPSRRTADFITVFSDVCEKTQKSFIRLLAPLKTFV